jgi:chromosome segregation ATPase
VNEALKIFNEAPARKETAEKQLAQVNQKLAEQKSQMEQKEKEAADFQNSLNEAGQSLAQQKGIHEKADQQAAKLRAAAASIRTGLDQLLAQKLKPAQTTVDASKQALASLEQNRQASRKWQAYVEAHLPAAKQDYDTAQSAAIRAEISTQAAARNAQALQADLDKARQDLDKLLLKKPQEDGKEPDAESSRTTLLLAEQRVNELEGLSKAEHARWKNLETQSITKRTLSDQARLAWEELVSLQKTSTNEVITSEGKVREQLMTAQSASEKILVQVNLEVNEARQQLAQAEKPALQADETAQAEAGKLRDLEAGYQTMETEMVTLQKQLAAFRESFKSLMEKDLVSAQEALNEAAQALERAPAQKMETEKMLAAVRQEIATIQKTADQANQKAQENASSLEASRKMVETLKKQQMELQSKSEGIAAQQKDVEKSLDDLAMGQSLAQAKLTALEKTVARLELSYQNAETDQASRLSQLELKIKEGQQQLKTMKEEAVQLPAQLDTLKARVEQREQAYEKVLAES